MANAGDGRLRRTDPLAVRARIEPPTEDEIAELEAARAANQERMDRLDAQGFPVNLMGGLLDHLIDEMIPDGTWWRHDFLVRWEARAAELLVAVEERVRLAILTNGGR